MKDLKGMNTEIIGCQAFLRNEKFRRTGGCNRHRNNQCVENQNTKSI